MAVIESALHRMRFEDGRNRTLAVHVQHSRQYGLTINSIVDERRDPVKATHAAAKYLIDLIIYIRTGFWL